MKIISVTALRSEREQLTQRIAAIDKLLTAVDAFGGHKKPGRPRKRRKLSAKALRNIRIGQKKRRQKEAEAKKAQSR